MSDLTDRAELDALVAELVDRARTRLTAAAADGRAREAELTAARKRTGNRQRTDELAAAIEAEQALAGDAHALAKRVAALKKELADDLARLVALALPQS